MEFERELVSIQQTGREMHRFVEGFRSDMLPWATLSPIEIFNRLKAIPYRYDPESVEFLQRPYYTMSGTGSGGDCDDKAICVASWARLRGVPYRFVAVGSSKEEGAHHVFAEIFLFGKWVPMDVTYSFNVMGTPRPWATREVLRA